MRANLVSFSLHQSDGEVRKLDTGAEKYFSLGEERHGDTKGSEVKNRP